ncbi:hypothetical protein [Bosea sp. (in: a-proteobacteria)]|uniref:hypothetical protein n=1 Tax=Bosea sp. (in: a-proteobacteria) TaxID=1871050 RepID=UPI00262E320D|nr:hypothetical protein [Bosea sp. (in: a-proteobacteria)]MCO5091990.1 hypothetical protein [Bosea sp. (in: a-proteobacteria)]
MTSPAIPLHRQAQPVDSFMRNLESRLASFDIFGGQEAPAPEPSKEDVQAQADAAAVFGTEAGARLLEWLADRSVRTALVVDPLAVDPARGWMLAQRHEGRNDMFYLVLSLLAAAKDEPAPRRDGPQT